jgi:hypothetical protein
MPSTKARGSPVVDPTSEARRPDTATDAVGRRAGYLVAAAINVVVLWVAHHLLEWGWPSFLTPDFDEVLPIISASCLVAIAFDLVLTVRDPRWLRTLGDVVGAVIGFAAAWRTYVVFPFDFSGWGTDWSWLLRTILVVAMFGCAIAAVVGVVGLVRRAGR